MGDVSGEDAVAGGGVGVAGRADAILGGFGAGQRPGGFVAIVVFAHHEDADGVGGVGELVLFAEEEVFVPVQGGAGFVEVGFGAEVDGTDFGAVASVTADDDHQALFVARFGVACVVAEADVVPDGAGLEEVIPGGDVEGRDLDAAVVGLDG